MVTGATRTYKQGLFIQVEQVVVNTLPLNLGFRITEITWSG
jgi:hypothetical protein